MTLLGLYNKASPWGKLVFWLFALLVVIGVCKLLFRRPIGSFLEGFESETAFSSKTGNDLYDGFYASVYDHLVSNQAHNDFTVGEIISKTAPSASSLVLDIGSGTGHHVAQLGAQTGAKVQGVDVSAAMVAKAKENYPEATFKQGDVTDPYLYQPDTFTHILCLYFTLYYVEDKGVFFANCWRWLRPGGSLIVHIVDRDRFDPILPPSNPLIAISPQRYAKERITTSKVAFDDDLKYTGKFEIDGNNARFKEKFEHTGTGKVRENEHVFYMETEQEIIKAAQAEGFTVQGKVDMVRAGYENQYLYILVKPE
jgi:SAM-dependent methyltransferase